MVRTAWCSSDARRGTQRAAGLVVGLLLTAWPAGAQQVPDSAYAPPIERPTFPAAAGPLVLIDEAHNDFHTAGGRFYPFARLLQRDGYRVGRLTTPLTAAALAELAGSDRVRIGMNDPAAPQNYLLVLNVMRWLARAD